MNPGHFHSSCIKPWRLRAAQRLQLVLSLITFYTLEPDALGQGGASPVPPSFSEIVRDRLGLICDEVVLSPTVTGTEPLVFQWRKDGRELPGKTNRVIAWESIRYSDGGEYTLVARNATGQTVSPGIRLHVHGNGETGFRLPSFTLVTSNAPVLLSVSNPCAQSATYRWSFRGSLLPRATNASLAVPVAGALSTGPYGVQVANETEGISFMTFLGSLNRAETFAGNPGLLASSIARHASGETAVGGQVLGTIGALAAGLGDGWIQIRDASGAPLTNLFVTGEGIEDVRDLAATPNGDWAILGTTSSRAPSLGGISFAGGGLLAPATFLATYPPVSGVASILTLAPVPEGPADASTRFDPSALEVDATGHRLIVGGFAGRLQVDDHRVESAGRTVDGVVIRISPSGTPSWIKTTGGLGDESFSSVASAPNGSIVIAGSHTGPFVVDGFAVPAGHRSGAFVLKLGTNGMPEAAWVPQGTGVCRLHTVIRNGDSGWIVGGDYRGSIQLVTSRLTSYDGSSDAFVVFLDANLVPLRFTGTEGSGEERIVALARRPDGEVFVAGSYSGHFVPSDAEAFLSHGTSDGFLMSLRPNLESSWILPLSGDGGEEVVDLAVGPDDDLQLLVRHEGILPVAGQRLGSSSPGARHATILQLGLTQRTAPPPETEFQTWIRNHFSPSELGPLSAPGGDPDGDGLPNFFEFLEGRDPRVREPRSTRFRWIPSRAIGGRLGILASFPAKGSSHATWAIEESSDGRSWKELGGAVRVPMGLDLEALSVSVDLTSPPGMRLFRLVAHPKGS